MRNTNRKRVLLVSGAIILLCITIIAGMTFALFTDEEAVNNHLKAGDLDITLIRTNLKSTRLTERGFLETVTDDTDKDFTNNKDENVFGLDGELIVPLSEYEADLTLTNKGDVAFKYGIQIVLGEDSDPDLAEQLEVTVTVNNADGTTETKRLNEGLGIGSNAQTFGLLAVGDDCDFSVKVKFLDDRKYEDEFENNDAQGDDVYFDLVVYAVQYTEKDPAN
ncbi:MAG: hypothetical protein IJ489_03795 [Clostridia bacterium]|nr:hypothetical protein [Clostridia bacterium]